VVEPVLKKLSFVVFVDYKKYVATEKHDPKIDILLETNNTYRTLCSLFIIVFLFKIYNFIELKYAVISDYAVYALIGVLFIIFLLSYKKQTEYIKKRIDAKNNSIRDRFDEHCEVILVGEGDMFYINHNNDTFTIIDCHLTEENYRPIMAELKTEMKNKQITRFISTHLTMIIFSVWNI